VFILRTPAAGASFVIATGAVEVNNFFGAFGAGDATGPRRPMTVLT
jgi:hypothetical protein